MNLFIQVNEGQPVNHPAFEDNLLRAFGRIPEDWEPFVRVEQPTPGVYELLDSPDPTYQKINGVWTDVWALRSMTSAEKTAKQDAVKAQWAQTGFASWVFDEDTCRFKAPVPRPTDGKNYRWDEPTISWIEIQE